MDQTVSATSYSVGDPVEVCDEDGSYHGVVIELVDSTTLCVQMMKKQSDNMYHISDDAYHVPHAAIAHHVPLSGDDDGAPRAFDALGFRMIDGSTFVKHDDETGDIPFPIGDAAFDMHSDGDSDSEGSLKDFIVPDEECEPFTLASSDTDFVRETHAAVRGFNAWIPRDDQEHQMRSFILAQESRAVAIDDNTRFARDGRAAPNYSNPG